MEPLLFQELQKIVRGFQGKSFWALFAGGSTGSHFIFEVGGCVPRHRPVARPDLPDAQRLFYGEYSLYVVGTWRIRGTSEFQTSWRDEGAHSDRMVRGLESLLHVPIVSADVHLEGLDLSIGFGNGVALECFVDRVDADGLENYSVFVNHPTESYRTCISVEPAYLMRKEYCRDSGFEVEGKKPSLKLVSNGTRNSY